VLGGQTPGWLVVAVALLAVVGLLSRTCFDVLVALWYADTEFLVQALVPLVALTTRGTREAYQSHQRGLPEAAAGPEASACYRLRCSPPTNCFSSPGCAVPCCLAA
jgi:hypothetical protein